jgi:hypothetical protein
MVRNRFLRNEGVAIRRDGVDARYEGDRAAGTPEWMESAAMVEIKEAEAIHAQALSELTERCRSAYLLVHEEKMLYRDVATKLGISIGLVANHVRNAQLHLAARILGPGMPSWSTLRAAHPRPRRRAPMTIEPPRRRVTSAPPARAMLKGARPTAKPARPKQIYAEPTATNSRRMAIVAEPTPTYEKASPTFG